MKNYEKRSQTQNENILANSMYFLKYWHYLLLWFMETWNPEQPFLPHPARLMSKLAGDTRFPLPPLLSEEMIQDPESTSIHHWSGSSQRTPLTSLFRAHHRRRCFLALARFSHTVFSREGGNTAALNSTGRSSRQKLPELIRSRPQSSSLVTAGDQLTQWWTPLKIFLLELQLI